MAETVTDLPRPRELPEIKEREISSESEKLAPSVRSWLRERERMSRLAPSK